MLYIYVFIIYFVISSIGIRNSFHAPTPALQGITEPQSGNTKNHFQPDLRQDEGKHPLQGFVRQVMPQPGPRTTGAGGMNSRQNSK